MDIKTQAELNGIPSEIPTSGQDWANHIAGYNTSDTQIKMVLEFENRLDIDCIIRAVRLSIDAEPVLGCSFEEHSQNPSWKRLVNIDEVNWCVLQHAESKEKSINDFLKENSKLENRQVQVKVLRCSESDVLCVTLNHSCSDAGGAKDYLYLLSDIYSSLCHNKDYRPKPNIKAKRDAGYVFKELGITDLRKVWNPQLGTSRPTWAFPYHKGSPQELNFAIRRFDAKRFKELVSFAREKSATINDLLLTAFYRALFDMILPNPLEPMEVTVTVDLRRYLPSKKAETICNLSGAINTRVSRVEGETFLSTLDRVSEIMKSFKSNTPGIHNAAAMELMRGMNYSDVAMFMKNAAKAAADSGKNSPLFSNLGVMAEYPFKFGDNHVKDLYLVSPAAYSPGFIFSFSTYNNVITLSVSYYEPTTRKENVEKFLDIIQNELISCISLIASD